jgi:uncharacterized protein
MKKHPIVAFVFLTYAIAWVFWLCAGPAGDRGFYIKWFGFLLTVSWTSIFFAIGGTAPGVAALFLNMWEDIPGTRRITAKYHLTSIRNIVSWSLIAVLLPVFVVSIAMSTFIARGINVLDKQVFLHAFGFFLLNLPLSSFWEEYGWRGYLLARLQLRHIPITASIFVGVVWGPWHLPRQLLLMPESAPLLETIILFMIQIVAISVLLSWIYNSSKASLIPVILFHGSFNVMVHALVTPITNQYGVVPYLFATILFVLAAAIIVLATGGRLGLEATDGRKTAECFDLNNSASATSWSSRILTIQGKPRQPLK